MIKLIKNHSIGKSYRTILILIPIFINKRDGYDINNDKIVSGWWITYISISFDIFKWHGFGLRINYGSSLNK